MRLSIELKLKKSVVVFVWNTLAPNKKAQTENTATQTAPKKCTTRMAEPTNKLSVKTRTAPKYTNVYTAAACTVMPL